MGCNTSQDAVKAVEAAATSQENAVTADNDFDGKFKLIDFI